MTRSSTRRCGRALAVLLAVVTGLILQATPAAAHAYVLATTPSNGTQVLVAPVRILVTFDEPVTLPSGRDSASVLDPAGESVGDGSVRLVDGRRTLVIGVRPGLAQGSYVASWSVVSADTHPVGGSLRFGYGVPADAVTASSAPRPSAALQLLAGLVKGLLYLGLVAALGLLPAGLVLGADPGERRILGRAARIGAALGVVASILQVGTQYLLEASAVPAGASWSGLGAFAGSAYSRTVLVRIGLLTVAAVALPPVCPGTTVPGTTAPGTTVPGTTAPGTTVPGTTAPRRTGARWAAEAVLAVVVLGSVVRNGHGGSGVWWRLATTVLHTGAAVAWLGGLAVLGRLVLRGRLPVPRLLRLPLWSRYAATSVGVLVLTGLLQGIVQVRRPAALISTTYGYVLIVKLVLVAAVLLLGLRGHRWIRLQLARAGLPSAGRQIAAGQIAPGHVAPGQTARLRTWVRAEAGFGAVVVLVSGVLSSTTPAVVAYAPRRTVTAMIGPYTVTIEVAPARRGPESFRITARGVTEATSPAQSVQLDLGQASGAVRALPVGFPYRLPGAIRGAQPTEVTFVSSAVNVPVTGIWTGTLTLIAGPTDQYTAAFTYRVL